MGEASTNGKDEQWLDFLRKGIQDAAINATPGQEEPKAKKKKKKACSKPPDVVQKPPFQPVENPPPRTSLPDELWLAVLECSCTFPPDIFNTVMLNLIKNPNITSSHLFRADVFYDSETDHLFDPSNLDQGLAKHLKVEYQPRPASQDWVDFALERTIVRQLIPRNPQLDKPLLQTCHFFTRQTTSDGEEQTQTLVLYIPHAGSPTEIPFYHPTLSQLAFLHTYSSSPSLPSHTTILYRPFPSSPLTPKHHRTALALLNTIYKHGQGALAGYTKRVHLDTIIPQKPYQDTYTRLKTAYASTLSRAWVEVTDPGKHVFEDLAIAAYLIELWKGMYGEGSKIAPAFPGFVDIGCGNGVLVYVLLEEGYDGWGFDARERKTWGIFPERIRNRLERKILVPGVLQQSQQRGDDDDEAAATGRYHSGIFPQGTFIVSNHADELTPWTPLLAYLNNSSFIAIPCCSHDLAGGRFRAPATTKAGKDSLAPPRLPQQHQQQDPSSNKASQAAETGSLKRTEAQKKMPSAYSTLCSYVASLAEAVGFDPETDVLRIPSTRNSCVVGRKRKEEHDGQSINKTQRVIDLIQQELRKDIASVGADWTERAEKLAKKPSSGH